YDNVREENNLHLLNHEQFLGQYLHLLQQLKHYLSYESRLFTIIKLKYFFNQIYIILLSYFLNLLHQEVQDEVSFLQEDRLLLYFPSRLSILQLDYIQFKIFSEA